MYDLDQVGAITVTTFHYEQGMIEPHDALASMEEYLARPHENSTNLSDIEVERIFFDRDGTPRERLWLPTEEHRTAFSQWAASVTLPSGETTRPLQDDFAYLQSGIHQGSTPLLNEHGG